jgi:hypothetical protein
MRLSPKTSRTFYPVPQTGEFIGFLHRRSQRTKEVKRIRGHIMSRLNWLFRVLPFAVVILTGCTTPVASLKKVHAGMTKEEVIRTLGEPYGRELRNGIEILIYDLATDQVRAAIYSGMLRSLNLSMQFYRFEFVDDRLKSYYAIEKPG